MEKGRHQSFMCYIFISFLNSYFQIYMELSGERICQVGIQHSDFVVSFQLVLIFIDLDFDLIHFSLFFPF